MCWSLIETAIMDYEDYLSIIWFNSRAPLSLHESIIFLAEQSDII